MNRVDNIIVEDISSKDILKDSELFSRSFLRSLQDVEYKKKELENRFRKSGLVQALFSCKKAYNFGQKHDDEELVQRDFGQFERRLDYIIVFKGKYNHDITKHTTEIVFHKGDKTKFYKMQWDVELCIDEDVIEKIIEESEKFNKSIEGEHITDSDNLYCRKKFLKFKKQYLRDFSRKIVSNYKQFMIETSSSESSKRKIDNIINDIIEIGEDFISENSENSLENEKKTNCK
ncbi:hypothetical protein F8M41_023593 [Gigaspora margarita]|uniref:Uncharacterized protein n=1 Tax=Gigaspora margarita TaxID=4874 RepID=A0A8H4AD64_GIGMA|nr:hypothetical protein F8M41_023593 [Gigaspora margarita]